MHLTGVHLTMIERIELSVEKTSAVNRNKVPEKQWRKWSVAGRKVFNDVYSTMRLNQPMFLHPRQEKVSKVMWKTTAWNAAWTAAGAV